MFPRPPNPVPYVFHNVPVELLLAAGKITFVLYHVEKTFQKHRRNKDKKKQSGPSQEVSFIYYIIQLQ